MDPQDLQAGAHHQWIGFADIVGAFPGRNLHRRDQGAAGRNDAAFGWPGQVRISSDQFGAVQDMVHGPANQAIVVIDGFADDHIIGVDVVKRNVGVVQRVKEAGFADYIGAAAGTLVA